ncbi:ORF60 [Leucania separata nucleopolyhedrovirus]|uniref:ORF60 n=1 Tax=Leucania separata nucleopolyhedrovirus TaxID=1307956 RepID=Q0IL59_NPVLS|nr:ORF60 [Leucania separata nucleopolyhedrovirus]AAR28824.1 ORF60 [Leucania separata nucleopolyhedrovirus]
MLITIDVNDKDSYVFKLFKRLWNSCEVECQICFDRILDEGVIAVTDRAALNIEKMFHSHCLERWRRENRRDPFNRNVKMWFNFPPKTLQETRHLLEEMSGGFIGDQTADKLFANEYERVHNARHLDMEIDFEKLLNC